MSENEQRLASNPATAVAARVVLMCIGGLLIYVALPSPIDSHAWWEGTSGVPFVLGVLALALAILAPNRWCEGVVALFP